LVGTTAVFASSLASRTSNINRLRDHATAKIVGAAANRLTSASRKAPELRREAATLEYYRAGSLPAAFGALPKEWTNDQYQQFLSSKRSKRSSLRTAYLGRISRCSRSRRTPT
jgi:hypothetical protein